MFVLAILIAVYSYLIMLLGIFGLYKREIINLFTVSYIIICLLLFRNNYKKLILSLKKHFLKIKADKTSFILVIILAFQIIINLIGALGPELSFDALWYHLTMPKLYLEKGRLFNIQGGLLYYSHLPQLGEMIYLGALSLKNEILAKLIHLFFGLLCLGALFKLLKNKSCWLVVSGILIFYSQLIVGWLSQAAYTDLIRTFFELIALYFFIEWEEKKNYPSLIKSAISIGFAVMTKLTAAYSLFSYLILISIFNPKKIKSSFSFLFFSLLIPLPWFIRDYLFSGNPVFPLNTGWFFKSQAGGLDLVGWLETRNIISLIKVYWQTVFTKGDILSPFLIAGLPILIFYFKKTRQNLIVLAYFCLNFFFFFLTPLNYNRFLLPYVPVFILLLIDSLARVENEIKRSFIMLLVFFSIINLSLRFVANFKFLPLILKQESKEEFMGKNLNFKAGNFYDINGWFKADLNQGEKVLIVGSHNLFYVDFPFDHVTWENKNEKYKYLIVQNNPLPLKYNNLKLKYANFVTGVKVYEF